MGNVFSKQNSHKRRESPAPREPPADSEDSWSALSEVAAPEPIDREDQAQRVPSLEETLSQDGSDPDHGLSEVAAPEPSPRDEEGLSRRSSLDENLAASGRR